MKTPELIDANHMPKINGWYETNKIEYKEQKGKRYNISHYVQGENKRAKKEENIRIALNMFKKMEWKIKMLLNVLIWVLSLVHLTYESWALKEN